MNRKPLEFISGLALFVVSMCASAERVDPLRPDMEGNWVAVPGGTPGDGPYR